MDDQKIKILELLEQGKISSAKAAELLDSLEHPKNSSSNQYNGIIQTVEGAAKSINNDMELLSEEFSKSFKNIDSNIYDNITLDAKKLSVSLKSLQQELESIVEGIVDGISKNTQSITESLPTEIQELGNNSILYRGIEDVKSDLITPQFDLSGISDKLSAIYGDTPAGISIKDYCLAYKKEPGSDMSFGMDIQCINGSVYIGMHEDSMIEVDLHCKTPESDIYRAISVTEDEDQLNIKAIKPDNLALLYNIKVPHQKLGQIKISSLNSKLRITDLTCTGLICSVSNTKLALSQIDCNSIKVENLNGKTDISDITAQDVQIKGSNSPVTVENIYANNMDINTASGKITLVLPENLSSKNEMKISQNGEEVEIELSQLPPSAGIYIDAFTQHGSIDPSNITNFSYSLNEQNKKDSIHIIGQTEGFDNASTSIKFIINNTNGPIIFR